MRFHHVAIVLVVGVVTKWFFFSSPVAEAEALPTPATLDLIQMHIDYPNMRDMPVLDVKEPF